jgi:hypothetical protein
VAFAAHIATIPYAAELAKIKTSFINTVQNLTEDENRWLQDRLKTMPAEFNSKDYLNTWVQQKDAVAEESSSESPLPGSEQRKQMAAQHQEQLDAGIDPSTNMKKFISWMEHNGRFGAKAAPTKPLGGYVKEGVTVDLTTLSDPSENLDKNHTTEER